jgi:hypothetical protein
LANENSSQTFNQKSQAHINLSETSDEKSRKDVQSVNLNSKPFSLLAKTPHFQGHATADPFVNRLLQMRGQRQELQTAHPPVTVRGVQPPYMA